MTNSLSSENKTNFYLERKDIHLFKESHEIIRNPWKITPELVNSIASCFSFNDRAFTFEQFRLIIYLMLSHEIIPLFSHILKNFHKNPITTRKWQPYQEGLFTTRFCDPEVIKAALRWVGERDDIAEFTETTYQIPLIIGRDAESAVSGQPLEGLANQITLNLINRIFMWFGKSFIPGELDLYWNTKATKNSFLFSYAAIKEVFSPYFSLLSLNDAYYMYSGIYLTKENVKSIFCNWKNIAMFVEETLANIWMWSLVQTSFFRGMREENSLFLFQDYIFSPIVPDYASFFTNQTYPLFSWDLNWISALRTNYFETWPQEVTYGGFRKYLTIYPQVSQKREEVAPFKVNPLGSTKLLDEKSRLVNHLNSRASDKPQVIVTFPIGMNYPAYLDVAFERILLPSLAKEHHIDSCGEGDPRRDLGVLPHAKNLERYYELFPDGKNDLKRPLENTVNNSSEYSITVEEGPNTVVYTWDEESQKALELFASYLANKPSTEGPEDEQTTEKSLTEKSWNEKDSEK